MNSPGWESKVTGDDLLNRAHAAESAVVSARAPGTGPPPTVPPEPSIDPPPFPGPPIQEPPDVPPGTPPPRNPIPDYEERRRGAMM